MEILTLLRTWMLCFSVILLTVSVSKADYDFTIRFHEFRNPLGLQCGECESDGPPACCDDVDRMENCANVAPRTCDTRFRFLLRPFGASVETAPTVGFPNFTLSNGGNSEVFNEGGGGFLGLMNPFTITNTTAWTGRIQFFIDALDRAAQNGEIEVLINRFPIDLELELGPNFTRANYTGIYNISQVEFDISFRVQCLQDYYGPNCTTFCTPMEGVYNCDNQGQFVCLQENRASSTNCTRCLPGYNDLFNCGECLLGRDIANNCASCLQGHDPSTDCRNCLPGYTFNNDRTRCIKIPMESTTAAPIADSASGGANLMAVSGVVGAIALILVIVVVALVVVVVLMVLYLRREKEKQSITSDTTEAQTGTGGGEDDGGDEPSAGERHDVENPLYGGTEQGTKTEEKLDLSQNAYTEIDHSPAEQKPSEPSSFPYNTLEHGEDAPQTVDLAEQGMYDNTIDEPVQTQPPEDQPLEEEPLSAANGTVVANGTATHDEGSDMLSAVLEEGPKPSPAALAGGIYDIPPQHSAATEAMTSEPAAPPDVPAEHEYAETEINRQPADSEQQQSTATYTNTTPGLISEEAVNHYDLGQ